jgi:predicted thioredoxin/glutaredoxin
MVLPAKIMLHQDVMVKIIVPCTCHNCSPFVLLFLGRDVLDGVDLLAALGVRNLMMAVLGRASVLVVGTLVIAGPVGRASVLGVGTLVIAGLDRASVET